VSLKVSAFRGYTLTRGLRRIAQLRASECRLSVALPSREESFLNAYAYGGWAVACIRVSLTGHVIPHRLRLIVIGASRRHREVKNEIRTDFVRLKERLLCGPGTCAAGFHDARRAVDIRRASGTDILQCAVKEAALHHLVAEARLKRQVLAGAVLRAKRRIRRDDNGCRRDRWGVPTRNSVPLVAIELTALS